jgi:hypothetical protein
VVPTAVPECGGEDRMDSAALRHDSEGRADGAVPGRFNVDEERGANV